MEMEVNLPSILWFRDYHEIDDYIDFLKGLLGSSIRGVELDFEEELSHLGIERGCYYPGLFWVKGHKPKKKDYDKLLGEQK